MRIFSTESIYDKENDEWVEDYYIDGEEVDFETWCDEQEHETFDDEEDDDICDCLDCTVNRFKNLILESGQCPDCVERILKDFVVDLFEKFNKAHV